VSVLEQQKKNKNTPLLGFAVACPDCLAAARQTDGMLVISGMHCHAQRASGCKQEQKMLLPYGYDKLLCCLLPMRAAAFSHALGLVLKLIKS
jgi:hypothetical protein